MAKPINNPSEGKLYGRELVNWGLIINIFKECFMLMRCIQVPNAVKDNISPVIKKLKKQE